MTLLHNLVKRTLDTAQVLFQANSMEHEYSE